jgi:hypothetical protein
MTDTDDIVTEEMARFACNEIARWSGLSETSMNAALRAVAPLIASRLQAENKRLKCLLEDALDDRLDRYGRIKCGDTLAEHIAAAIRARGET